MPNNTKYLGIIREPKAQFQSILRYMPPHTVFNKNTRGENPVAKFLQNPRFHEPSNPRMSFSNNRMAVEFGFPLDILQSRNLSQINEYILKLDSEFNLVIIVELIDECLILMKRMFCWSFRDIVYIASNQNSEVDHVTFPWTDMMDRQLKAWNMVDYALYEYFNQKTQNAIKNAGSDFTEEVKTFKGILARVNNFCRHDNSSVDLDIPASHYNEKFALYKYDCWLMELPEIPFIDVLRNLQYPKMERLNDDLPIRFIHHISTIIQKYRINTMT